MERTTVFVRGKVYWAKIVGDPVDNYEGDAKEWTYELVPYDVTFLKEHRLLDRLKDREDAKNPDKGEYLVLRKPAVNKDGEENKPIAIYDSDNSEWDGRLLGNGTEVVAKLTIVDWGKGKKKSIWTQAIRVEDLVPYVGNAFSGFDEAEEDEEVATPKKASKAAPKKKSAPVDDDDLDDDIPF